MTDQLSTRTRWLALVILCVGDLMIVVDTTVVNVAAALTGGYHVAFLIGAVFSIVAGVVGATFLRTRTAPAGSVHIEPALEQA